MLGPLADAARAQTPLADIPIASKVTAKPNIVYTLDDSGSMQFGYLPDWVIAAAATANVTKITRVGAIATVQVASTAALSVGQFVIIAGANQPEYNGEFQIVSIPTGTTFTIAIVGTPISPATGAIKYAVGTTYCRGGSTTAACSAGAVNTFTSPPFYASSFNHLMYDPNVNYQPPVNYDGSPLTHTIGTDTDALGNQSKFNNVQSDPFTSPNAHVNLTAKVAVPLYCNTDWPITKGGPTSNLTIADVGDANGENSPPVAGVGDWCRINGTEYAASLASGAPPVTYANGNVLYDYPYRSSSGANGPEYFYRQLGNKILYCDKTSPYWPRVKGAIIGCTLGGTPTCGGLPCTPVITKQTCNLSTPAKTCNPTPALRNFTPSVCKTPSALYCLPSVGGSDSFSPGTGTAPECEPCTCDKDYQPANTKKCSVVGNACTSVCGVPGCDTAECPDQSVTPAPNGCSAGVPIYNYTPAGSATCTAVARGTPSPARRRRRRRCRTPTPKATPAATTTRSTRSVAHRRPAACSPIRGPTSATSTPRTRRASRRTRRRAPSPTPRRSGCPTIGTTISIPRHYYTVDSIQFCDNTDNTVDGPWRGFGAGVCKPANDLTQYQNVQYGQFHRVGLDRRTHLRLHRPGHAISVDPHVRAGDHQLRELVCLLPASRTRREDDLLARIQPAGRHVPRRLPDARPGASAHRAQPRDRRPRMGRRRRFQARRREPAKPVVERAVRRPHGHQRQDADALRDAAGRQPVRDGQRRRASGRRLPAPRGGQGSARWIRPARS